MSTCCAKECELKKNGDINIGETVSWHNRQNGYSGTGIVVTGKCRSEDGVIKWLIKVTNDGFKISGKSPEAKDALVYWGVKKGSGPYQWATFVETHDGRYIGNINLLMNKTMPSASSVNVDVLSFLRNSELTDDDKLLIELGLEDPTHVPTAKGIQIAQELIYRDKRAEIITIAQKLKAEQDKEKESSN
jgi:hypothetical protein